MRGVMYDYKHINIHSKFLLTLNLGSTVILLHKKINPHGVTVRIIFYRGYKITYFISQISFVSNNSLNV